MKFNAAKSLSKNYLLKILLPALVALIIGGIIYIRYWYSSNLEPLNSTSQSYSEFVVESGQSVAEIAESLEDAGLIRNKTAFVWYVRGDQAGVGLQAGTYSLSPSMSVEVIVNLISEGKVDAYRITLLPGKRLDQTRQEMIDSGHWSEGQVDTALAADYDHPLLKDRPAGASLEGYIYPDTYEINDATSAEDLINRALDNFYQKIEERGMTAKLQAQDLNLHQAIILASIIEREAGTDEEKPQIAQVFLKRLEDGLSLGADATFVYGAAVSGEEVSVDIDSPYNTRLYTGLPPGPIANMIISSLAAVAEPADGEYLYFVTGDDGITRFSKTLSEHRALVDKYCQERCRLVQP